VSSRPDNFSSTHGPCCGFFRRVFALPDAGTLIDRLAQALQSDGSICTKLRADSRCIEKRPNVGAGGPSMLGQMVRVIVRPLVGWCWAPLPGRCMPAWSVLSTSVCTVLGISSRSSPGAAFWSGPCSGYSSLPLFPIATTIRLCNVIPENGKLVNMGNYLTPYATFLRSRGSQELRRLILSLKGSPGSRNKDLRRKAAHRVT
jgi:hypothetical protein